MNRDLIEQWAAGGTVLRRSVSGLTPEDLTARPGPGQWSILEVVVHLTDSEEISIDRMKRILTEDNPPLIYADETAYVDKLFTHDQSLEDALTLFEVSRRQFARVLRKLPDAAFLRKGNHSRKGEMTISGIIPSYIDHLNYHVDFILRKRVALGKPLA